MTKESRSRRLARRLLIGLIALAVPDLASARGPAGRIQGLSVLGHHADLLRLEQAFSAAGGQTWEANWIAKFERCRPRQETVP